MTQITIILKDDPASLTAMKKMALIKQVTQNTLKGTRLGQAKIAVGGQTAQTNDIKTIATSDFGRTALLMLIGILITLMIITKSILQPFYILGTLILAYASALTLTKLGSALILKQDNLTWNTPFFTFIMLVALGVDYSIFLMMKYREYDVYQATPVNRIVKAATVIGTVVLSAAIILGGTFAALIPSGVLTLIQVAIAVMIGLVILAVILPIIIPSAMRLTYPLQDKFTDNAE